MIFHIAVAKTQIIYLILIKNDIGVCKNRKFIPTENFIIQRKLIVMNLDLRISKKKEKNDVLCDKPKIIWERPN